MIIKWVKYNEKHPTRKIPDALLLWQTFQWSNRQSTGHVRGNCWFYRIMWLGVTLAWMQQQEFSGACWKMESRNRIARYLQIWDTFYCNSAAKMQFSPDLVWKPQNPVEPGIFLRFWTPTPTSPVERGSLWKAQVESASCRLQQPAGCRLHGGSRARSLVPWCRRGGQRQNQPSCSSFLFDFTGEYY
jgi:hypothetical protein